MPPVLFLYIVEEVSMCQRGSEFASRLQGHISHFFSGITLVFHYQFFVYFSVFMHLIDHNPNITSLKGPDLFVRRRGGIDKAMQVLQ